MGGGAWPTARLGQTGPMPGLAFLALVSSVLLGISDYLGGALSRRVPLIIVLLGSQVVASMAIAARLLVDPFRGDLADAVMWGSIAGLAQAIGVAALFRGLAIGTMGVVAPVSALSVLVPVSVGLATGDTIGPLLGVGLAVAVVGSVLATGPEFGRRRPAASGDYAFVAGRPPRRAAQSIALALIAAAGFGTSQVGLARGAAADLTTTLVMTAVVVLGVYIVAFSAWIHVRLRGAAARLHRGRPAMPALVPMRIRGRDAVAIASIGMLVYLANAAYGTAAQAGTLSVVAVLASLYPAVVALLSWRLLGERLRPVQTAGVVLVLAGVAAIAAGSAA
ncbi:EamA-like transporter family protein [Microcella alkaliphila]|uniref:EamA-like transporter family protein n=2 Tax=Microcella alkaliphila TaxID=279828 RepID=A0A4Q7TAP4_9MICO|nr:EamA-like transporter family protein [Microcella alkaliphila]